MNRIGRARLQPCRFLLILLTLALARPGEAQTRRAARPAATAARTAPADMDCPATLGVGQAIIMEASLSFLGLGVQQPTPTWGNMLFRAQSYLTTAPWIAIFPGCLILITVLCVNFIGDGLRDALDPHTRR